MKGVWIEIKRMDIHDNLVDIYFEYADILFQQDI